jgi:hypothetical protein
VVTQLGYKVPYQLHCDAQADELEVATELDAELGTELEVFTELLVEIAVLVDDEVRDELTEVATDDEVATPLQIAPVTAGVSTVPLVFTCIPNATVCPG